MRYFNKNKGFVGYIILFLIIFGLLGIYLSRSWYIEKYYITLYDDKITRYLDIPPFAERISPASDELRGRCKISIGSSASQAFGFLKSVCDKSGYVFRNEKDSVEIEIRKNYIIKCSLVDEKLVLTWTPVLTGKLKQKFEKLFPNETLNNKKVKKNRKQSKK